MSERLEEIKERFKAMNELPSFKKLAPTELFFDDIDYLIQQAKRVKRHKQALEFYADEDNYEEDKFNMFVETPLVEYDRGKKARKILGGNHDH
ncbi:hypothetical protein [Oceanobacillus caeni]|uniref:hypothetical protein n=1 Tax=Oceanobacillus caeni TaxID=405946 RepID=UPI003636148D